MNRRIVNIIGALLLVSPLLAEPTVRIVKLHGDVRVRRGLEEAWSPAGVGMPLKPLDTIFSGEASEVVLALEDQSRFILGGNAVLDIGDLRRITERQLFLFLMSQKVSRIAAPDSASAIHITNVSVVRGSQKQIQAEPSLQVDTQGWIREKNGARALLEADYYTNAIVKFYKIMQRYPAVRDKGEIHWYLGQAFEALKETGRAVDAYQTALEQVNDSSLASQPAAERKTLIEAALRRLKSNS
jgi:tetratricopeptide (TPR) repeat protein